MNDARYIGLDVHQATISVVVLDCAGHLVMESIIETKAAAIPQLIHGLRGSLHVTFEEGTCAAWLHDLLKPHVASVLVCDPRKNALLKAGNKNDRIDARKLADLLRAGLLSPVYHGENGIRTLKELARSYLALTRDATRVMNRLKALYRSWAIPCTGQKVYAARYRNQWLAKIPEAGVRRRAEFYYQQLDALQTLRQQVRYDLLAESRKHSAMNLLRQIPSLGPIRASLLDRSDADAASLSRQATTVGLLWFGIEDLHEREYRFVEGQLKRSKKLLAIRGLHTNHNHDLKNIFKGAATRAAAVLGPFQEFHAGLVARGMKPTMARLTLARKIAAITLLVWKKGVCFDAQYLKQQAA